MSFIDWIISKLGCCRTCADCKHFNECHKEITQGTLDTPECERFEEDNYSDN